MRKRIIVLVILCLMTSASVGACPEGEMCSIEVSPSHPIYQGETMEMNDLVYRGEPITVLPLNGTK